MQLGMTKNGLGGNMMRKDRKIFSDILLIFKVGNYKFAYTYNFYIMASLNKVMLIGNLGKDPETRTLQSGMTVTSITLATNESYTDRNGNRVDQTEWHSVELWDNLSKIASQYLRKGSPVYIEGKLKTDSWEDNGVKKYSTKIRALGLQLLGTKGEGGGGNSYQQQEYEAPKVAAKGTADVVASNGATDDLPF